MESNSFGEYLKRKSVKFSGRNLQELRKETEPLASRNKEMEEKLQQLKYSMSKEKEERRNPESSRWMIGQSEALNLNPQRNSTSKNKEEKLHKLSTGTVKIRVLTEEPPAASRKSRLKGKICGQCEVKTAGLMCAECKENYCIGCFTQFHLKGAMKYHKMVPLKEDLKTHITTQAVTSRLQKASNLALDAAAANRNLSPSRIPKTENIFTYNASVRPSIKHSERGTETTDKHLKMHSGFCQEERKMEIFQDEMKGPNLGFPTHLKGEFDEEESARSFQEAVRQWRAERTEVSMSTKATQAEVIQNRVVQIGERGARKGSLPLKVEFNECSLTYLDKLILKKHRRTPVETYCPTSAALRLPSTTDTEEETTSYLTAEEEDFRLYCASLFAVPVTGDKTKPQITQSESCLFIDFQDEIGSDTEDRGSAENCKKKEDNENKVQSVQQMVKRLPIALSHDGSSRVSHSFYGPQQSRRAAVHLKAPQKRQDSKSPCPLNSFSPDTSSPALSSTENSGTSYKCTSRSASPQRTQSTCSGTIQKSKENHRSPCSSLTHSKSGIFKSSQSQPSSSADTEAGDCVQDALREDCPSLSTSTSFPLRSTFTVSPYDSTESSLLPKVPSPCLSQEDSGDLIFEQESLQPLTPKAKATSPKCEPRSPEQSKHYPCDLTRFRPNSLTLSTVSSELLEQNQSQLSAVTYREISPDSTSRASSANLLTTACEDQMFPSPSSRGKSAPLNISQNVYVAFKMEEEDEQPVDSGDEMSSDSLSMGPRYNKEENQGHLMEEEESQEVEVNHTESDQAMYDQIVQYGAHDDFYLNDVSRLAVDLNTHLLTTSEHPSCESLPTFPSSLQGSNLKEPSADLHQTSTLSLTQPTRISPSPSKHVRPTISPVPTSPPFTRLYGSKLGSNSDSALRASSRAAEAILEISSVDPMGCEDPDLDTDMAAQTLIDLERDWRFMDKDPSTGVCLQTSCGNQAQPGNHPFIQVTVGTEQEEELAKTDRLSVLLLP